MFVEPFSLLRSLDLSVIAVAINILLLRSLNALVGRFRPCYGELSLSKYHDTDTKNHRVRTERPN